MIPPFPLAGKRIWVAGHNGMVGSALMRTLAHVPCTLLTISRSGLDLREKPAVHAWITDHKPDIIVLAAARVGGIQANSLFPADFLYDNLAIASSVIHAAHLADVNRLLFLGSSCIYPRNAPQPISEESLLSGTLEETNQWYAIAKIAGVKLCQAYRRQYGRDYITVMPCNLYGAHDTFDPERAHVIPALIAKAITARKTGAQTIPLLGTGTALREFLHVDDLARALVVTLETYSGDSPLNIGSGDEISIATLAEKIRKLTRTPATFVPQAGTPDGTPRKVLNSNAIRALGWIPRIDLDTGLARTCAWYEHEITANSP